MKLLLRTVIVIPCNRLEFKLAIRQWKKKGAILKFFFKKTIFFERDRSGPSDSGMSKDAGLILSHEWVVGASGTAEWT